MIIFDLVLDVQLGSQSRARATLALVCKEWHQVLYETPSLWTRILEQDAGPPTSLALKLSRNRPLNVKFDFSTGWCRLRPVTRMSFEEACMHLHRWRSAELTVDAQILTMVSRLTKRPAPLLQTIILKMVYQEMESSLVDIFGNEAPRLRHIHLIDVAVLWDSGIFSGLRVLVLDKIPSQPPLTLDHIVSALSNSPQLQTFTLVDTNILVPPGQAPSPIHLPSLLELGLVGASPGLTQLPFTVHQCATLSKLQAMYVPLGWTGSLWWTFSVLIASLGMLWGLKILRGRAEMEGAGDTPRLLFRAPEMIHELAFVFRLQ